MAGKLTNRAEFMERYMEVLRKEGWSMGDERATIAEQRWGMLCRAGLAEEELEPGDYHVKWDTAYRWSVGRLFPNGTWREAGISNEVPQPAIIGPRICEPKE